MREVVTSITYTCDLCGKKTGNDCLSEDMIVKVNLSSGDRDVGPSYIMLQYVGCNIPYSPNTPKDICMDCFHHYLQKYLDEHK